MRKRFSLIVLVVALFLLLGGLSFAVDLYFDFLWFREMGKSVVFTTALVAQSALTTLTLLVSFLFLFLNLLQANRGPGEIQLGIPTPTGQITAYVVTRQMVRRIAGLAALVAALFLGLREAQLFSGARHDDEGNGVHRRVVRPPSRLPVALIDRPYHADTIHPLGAHHAP